MRRCADFYDDRRGPLLTVAHPNRAAHATIGWNDQRPGTTSAVSNSRIWSSWSLRASSVAAFTMATTLLAGMPPGLPSATAASAASSRPCARRSSYRNRGYNINPKEQSHMPRRRPRRTIATAVRRAPRSTIGNARPPESVEERARKAVRRCTGAR